MQDFSLGPPLQQALLRPFTFSVADTLAFNCAIIEFLKQNKGRCVDAESYGFFSNVFLAIKADCTQGEFLNLWDVQVYILHVHFQMESVSDVINLVQNICFFMSIDITDTFFFPCPTEW